MLISLVLEFYGRRFAAANGFAGEGCCLRSRLPMVPLGNVAVWEAAFLRHGAIHLRLGVVLWALVMAYLLQGADFPLRVRAHSYQVAAHERLATDHLLQVSDFPGLVRHHLIPVRGHLRVVTDHSLLVNDFPEQVRHHQFPVRDHQTLVNDHQEQKVPHQRLVSDHQKQKVARQTSVNDHQEQVSDHHGLVNDHLAQAPVLQKLHFPVRALVSPHFTLKSDHPQLRSHHENALLGFH